MPSPWLIYCRVSTEEQAQGTSLDSQEAACRGMLSARGLAAGEVLRDEVSGASLQRPGLQRLLGLIAGGGCAGVVVWRLDRLTRRLRDLLDLVERLSQARCALMSCMEMIDTSGPQGRLFLQLLGAFAEYERESIRERITASVAHRRAQGVAMGRPAVGLLAVRGEDGVRRFVVDPRHGPAVAKAWKLAIGGASLVAIAGHLERSGVPAPLGGGPWRKQSVHYLLRCRSPIGLLVSSEDHERAVQAISQRRFGPAKDPAERRLQASHSQRVWRLAGIAVCGRCGSRIAGVSARGRGGVYHYLRCQGRAHRGKGFCPAKDLPAQPIEDQVVEALSEALGDGEALREHLEACEGTAARVAHDADEQVRRLTLRRDQARERERRLVELVELGDLAPRTASPRLKQLGEELAGLERELAERAGRKAGAALTRAECATIWGQVARDHKELAKWPWERQREALAALVAEVRIGDGRIDLAVALGRAAGQVRVRRKDGLAALTVDEPAGRGLLFSWRFRMLRGARGRWFFTRLGGRAV